MKTFKYLIASLCMISILALSAKTKEDKKVEPSKQTVSNVVNKAANIVNDSKKPIYVEVIDKKTMRALVAANIDSQDAFSIPFTLTEGQEAFVCIKVMRIQSTNNNVLAMIDYSKVENKMIVFKRTASAAWFTLSDGWMERLA